MRPENDCCDLLQLKIGWKAELDVGRDVSGMSANGKSNALVESAGVSILVVCVASRSALIVELALKQFSTRSDTPRHVRKTSLEGKDLVQ